jgi:hypothetical protein
MAFIFRLLVPVIFAQFVILNLEQNIPSKDLEKTTKSKGPPRNLLKTLETS